MITWMQKHKKWLIITIWVSAIAFIGAGMVNWGSYGFSLSNDKIARVGEIDIRMPEYQRAYNATLREYGALFQSADMIDEAQARQLGIPQIALRRLIQQAQLRNFAHDLGLMVSDNEVAQAIIDEKVQVDEQGNFSPELYKAFLKQRGMSTSEFEEDVRNQLLVQKLLGLVNVNGVPSFVTPLEEHTLEMAYGINDRLMVKIIPISQIKTNIDEQEMRAFWELNAEQWKTPMEFEIEYIFVPFSAQHPTQEALQEHYENFKSDYLDENGHLMSIEQSMSKLTHDVQKLEAERAAKREYRDLKNGSKNGEKRIIKENEGFFIKRGIDLVVADMKAAQVGQVLQPIEADGGFVTLKLLGKKESINQTFEEAKDSVKVMYKHHKAKEGLTLLAKEQMENFVGTDIGFVNRFSQNAILTLNENEKSSFLSQVFHSRNPSGYVLFDDKVVLYRVLEQTYFTPDKGDALVKNAKMGAIHDALIEYLNKMYKTTMYIDVSK